MKNCGKTWTAQEEQEFYNQLKSKSSFSSIAKKHERSVGALKSRAKRLNLLNEKGKLLSPLPTYIPYIKHGYSKEKSAKTKETNISFKITPESNIEALKEEGAISVRLYNALNNLKAINIEDTLQFTPKQVLRQPNCGRSTLIELQKIQKKFLQENNPQEKNKEKSIISLLTLKEFQKDTEEFCDLIKNIDNENLNNKKILKNSLKQIKTHIQEFDKALLTYNYGLENQEKVDEIGFEESGLTAQKILSLIEEIIVSSIKDERAAYIIKGRIGLLTHTNQMTLQDLGDELGVSRERIRQIEKKNLKLLMAHIKKYDYSYNVELKSISEGLFLNTDFSPLYSMVKFCSKFYIGLIDRDIWTSIVATNLGLFKSTKIGFSQIKSINRTIDSEIREETINLFKNDKYINHWRKIFSQGSYPQNRKKFDNFIPQMTGRYREINKNSTGRTGSYFSKKCNREICYESGEEHRLYEIMEKTDKVTWYQEQPISIPYQLNDKQYQYRPDLAVITDDGYGTVIEVKPPFNLVQLPTLRKAIEAVKYLHERGIGFILVDSHGRSLKNLSTYPIDNEIAKKIMHVIDDKGEINYETYKEIVKDTKIKTPEFVSMMVHNNLTFMSRPFRIWRLPKELSYDFLLS